MAVLKIYETREDNRLGLPLSVAAELNGEPYALRRLVGKSPDLGMHFVSVVTL